MTEQTRWVIHLPTTLTDLDQAIDLASALRASLGHLDAIDFGEATLSAEDRQFLRTRVWCDARLPGGGPRCVLADGHPGECAAPPG